MTVQECILLSGAGFTHNFGAPLATDVWALLFSHPDIKRHQRIHNLLRENFDFEDIYYTVATGDFNTGERQACERALVDVYDYIDSIVRLYRTNSSFPNIYGVQTFLNSFSGSRDKPGFIFTLNQDLFIERHFYNGTRPTLPGVPVDRDWFTTNSIYKQSPIEIQTVLPSQSTYSLSSIGADPLYYIKLHGSSNWFNSQGTQSMVIGRAKNNQIEADTLLTYYFQIFRKVMFEGTRRVLCTGYSFRDPHINEVLAGAVSAGVEVFILSPEHPKEAASRLKTCPRGQEIWEGLSAYFPFNLLTLFPSDQRQTHEWKVVSYRLFGKFIES